MRAYPKGFVFIGLAIVIGVVIAVLWFVHLLNEARTQPALQQSQDKRAPAQSTQTAKPPVVATPVGAQEDRAAGNKVAPPAAASARDKPILIGAIVLTGLAVLGLGGYALRLAQQGRRLRVERQRLVDELHSARAPATPPEPAPVRGAADLSAALRNIRASAFPAIAYDLEAHVLEVSESFTRLTSYTRDDIPDASRWFSKVLRVPEFELEAALESFRDTGRAHDLETHEVWTLGGECRTWQVAPLEIWPIEGGDSLLVARAVDVTNEVQAVRAAHAEAESLRVVLRAASRPQAAPAEARAPSEREAALAEQLTRRDDECQRLGAQARSLRERIAAQDAELAAVRAKETDLERRAAALAHDREQDAVLLKEAYRAAGAGLCLLGPDLKPLRTNARWEEMTRVAGSVQAALDAIEACARDTLHSREPRRDVVVAIAGVQGAQRTWRIDCEPIAAAGDELAGIALTARDVTDDTRHLARLQEDNERLQGFAEQFEESLWLADPRVPRLVYANAASARMRGRPLERMSEDFAEWTAAIHEKDRERVRQAFFAAAMAGTYDVEYRVVRDDGGIVWLHDRASAVRDSQGRLRHLAGITRDVSVRKNAEIMARTMLATLKSIVTHTPAAIWMKDAHGRYLYANPGHERLTHFSLEQLRGKTDLEIFPRPVAERLQRHDAQVIGSNTTRQFEETLQRADGRRHYLALTVPVRDAEMPAAAMCGIAFDVTERRQREDALRADENRFRAIAASLPLALFIARENKVMYANRAAQELLGAGDAEAVTGLPLTGLCPGAEPVFADAARALTLDDATGRNFSAHLKTTDGRNIEVDVNATAYETTSERAVQFIVQDVGERNERIRALERAEAFFHELCDASPAPLRLLDTAGRIDYASRGWSALAGTASGGDWLERVHPDDRAIVRQACTSPAPRNASKCVEYRLRDGDGLERWVADRWIARHDAQGAWGGYIASTLDISERRQIEDALHAHRDDLAGLLECCPAPIWVADANGGYANQACRTWLGVAAEEATRLDLRKHVHPEDRDAWLTEPSSLSDAKGLVQGEYRLRRADGEYRNVRIRAVPVPALDRAGAPRLVSFLDDITEFRRTAEALRIAEQRRGELINLLGSRRSDGLASLRNTARMVQVLFPNEAKMQKASGQVLADAQRLETLVAQMLEPLQREVQTTE